MKVTNMARLATAFTFLTVSLVGAYTNYRARESYDRMCRSINDMKKRMFDVRTTANTLSRQMRMQKDRLDSVLDLAKDSLYYENEDHDHLTNETEDIPDDAFTYTVKEHNGIIGIFNQEGLLVDEKCVGVSALSACDRHDLAIGIRVKGDKELEELLDELK